MNKVFFILFLSAVMLFTFSCMQPRYISRNEQVEKLAYEKFPIKSEPYRLQPYDYLYVKIKTSDKDINELFEGISTQVMSIQSDYYFFLTGYLINDSGYVYIPLVGNIKAAGKTLGEVRKIIRDSISKNLTNAVVNVRLTSFNVYLLGEVSIQGQIKFYKERVSILEAISKAGGITQSGDRKNVYVIRRQDSIYNVYKLDLTNKNIIGQKDFFIQPNDIIYVPRRKFYNLKLFISDYMTLLTFISTTITTVFLILNLRNGR